jgi:hypothetical protein
LGYFKPERSEIPPPPPAMRIGTRRLSSDLSSSTTWKNKEDLVEEQF